MFWGGCPTMQCMPVCYYSTGCGLMVKEIARGLQLIKALNPKKFLETTAMNAYSSGCVFVFTIHSCVCALGWVKRRAWDDILKHNITFLSSNATSDFLDTHFGLCVRVSHNGHRRRF